MSKQISAWAMRRAGPEDRGVTGDAHRRDTLQIKWPDLKALRRWAGYHAWPTPWFNFEGAFINKMLESDENFALAIEASGIEIDIPKREYTISAETLRDLDALYAERSPSGRPTSWGTLVEELREIRRAVEAGVVVTVAGTQKLGSWQGFYDWAHGRYHMLEDGYDSWIGDDGS